MKTILLLLLLLLLTTDSAVSILTRANKKKYLLQNSCTNGACADDSTEELVPSSHLSVWARKLVTEQVSYKDIVTHYKYYSMEEVSVRHLPASMNTLGFVTPWNSAGYELSLLFHQKFTHLSPVWFAVYSTGRGSWEMRGSHDVNAKWLKKLYKLNSNIKIIPRILFDNWTPQDFAKLFTDPRLIDELINDIIGLVAKYRMHGIVLELWRQAGLQFEGEMIEFITYISSKLHARNLIINLIIPPTLPETVAQEAVFNGTHYALLTPHVDLFTVMTYDYSLLVKQMGPNSPLQWIEGCVNVLQYGDGTSEQLSASKLLIGLNFYGYEYTRGGMQPVTGRDYIDSLKKYKQEITWHEQFAEHISKIDEEKNPRMTFYPSLYSIDVRLQLAKRLNTGVAVWELGQGLDYFLELL